MEASIAHILCLLVAYLSIAVGRESRRPLESFDFVYACPSARTSRLDLSRRLREGIRTILVLDNKGLAENLTKASPAGEHQFLYQPEVGESKSGQRHFYRAAIAPFLAHEAVDGNYKWMLFGDDDTIWLMKNVERLLENYDHRLPYAISDYMYFGKTFGTENTVYEEHNRPWSDGSWHAGSTTAPRCLPCHLDLPAGWQESLQGPMMMRACSCSPRLACMANRKACAHSRFRPPFPYGGAGIILSRGLFDHVDKDEILQCIRNGVSVSNGGDQLLAHCLWKQGIAATDPGEVPFGRRNRFNRFRYLPALLHEMRKCKESSFTKGCWDADMAISQHIVEMRDVNNAKMMEELRAQLDEVASLHVMRASVRERQRHTATHAARGSRVPARVASGSAPQAPTGVASVGPSRDQHVKGSQGKGKKDAKPRTEGRPPLVSRKNLEASSL